MLDERLVEAVHEQADDCPLGDQTHARRFGSDVLKCVKCLLRELKPWEAALMAPLSILESLLLARVGTIAGSFYHLVVDKMQNELAVAMLCACGLYMACIAIEAFSVWLSGYLAVKWRKTLITRLQDRYCTRYAYTKVDSRIDNADQRLTAELAKLCDLLGTVVRLLSSAPIKILYFSWLTHTYVGWKGVAAALAFFLISAAVQQLTAIPLAWAVAEQEKQEGNLRFLHMRLRSRAEDISLAASEGSQAELAALNATLAPVLRNQKKVVRRRALVTATSRTSDYAGALLNYGLVAAVVFSGASEATSAGKMAEFVSNASYFTLSLIYSFTQVLDLAETLGTVAALTVRTVHLLETLPKSADTQKITHDEQMWEDGREMMLNLRLATMLLSPTEMTFLENTAKLEISAHSFSAALGTELIPVFPDLVNEKSCNPIICCLTFQFARGGFEGATSPASPSHDEIDVVTNSEMDRLLETFLRWEASMRHEIAKAGPYWSDSIDPQRGTALHGERGARWSEVAAAHLLLGYNRQDDGVCPLILHPIHGSRAYPASIFTNAPWPVVLKALRSLSSCKDDQCTPTQLLSPTSVPLIRMHNVTVFSPYDPAQKRALIKNLSLSIYPGQHLLVTGPNGRGKTSLFKCMFGQHRPLMEGMIEWPYHQCSPAHGSPSSIPAMFLPQHPLTAPGSLLWQQIAYPGVERPPDATLQNLVLSVGLADLLRRIHGNFDHSESDWSAVLSAGELQRLVFARLLLRKPKYAFLDEPASAMSDEEAEILFQLLQESGTTCLTISQDTPTMRRLHSFHLKLTPEGGHQLLMRNDDDDFPQNSLP